MPLASPLRSNGELVAAKRRVPASSTTIMLSPGEGWVIASSPRGGLEESPGTVGQGGG